MVSLQFLQCWTVIVISWKRNSVDAHLMNKHKAGFVLPRYEVNTHPTRGRDYLQRKDGKCNALPDPVSKSEVTKRQANDRDGCLQRRQFLFATAILATQMPPNGNALSNPNSERQQELLTTSSNYQKSPINKRSGITLSEPERIYPINFITYLSRFLLVFDPECQAWWYTQASAIPTKSSKEDVDQSRLKQFGQFAASVEVGLVDFEGDDGPRVLLEELVKRYANISLEDVQEEKDLFSLFGTIGSTNSTQPTQQQQQKLRKKKEALRQIALMFSLLKEYQPVELITQLLAVDDDAKIEKVIITDGGTGYLPPEYNSAPKVTFPDSPGTMFGGSTAKGTAIMEPTGHVLKVDVINGGNGYINPPSIEISIPNSASSGTSRATAKAILGKGKLKGTVERIVMTSFGMGYSSTNDVTVKISPPDSPDGEVATAKAVLEYEVSGVEILYSGRGYAAERPVRIMIDPPSSSGKAATAISYPTGKSTSFKSFITIGDSEATTDATSNWIIGPSSSQLLSLLPSGYGVEFDTSLKRYILTTAQSDEFEDSLFGTLEGMQFKPLNPIFGFRGRSPIEREKSLDTSTVLRFIASGAICSSIAHLVLTPIDVVKTKVQTKPDVYNGGIIETFKKVFDEEGANTFFDGWEPTFLGFFCTGGVSFFFTEYFRRLYTSFVVSYIMTQTSITEAGAAAAASSYEIPLVAASAATAGFLCCFILSPFDAIRIRTVSQPDFAENIGGVVSRMIKEEGFLSLFSAFNAWVLKEVPYNVVKFLVFDSFTEWAYSAYPVAQEDIRLSLVVSLLGGSCGGIAASIVSNPADVIVSEMKKSKSDLSPLEAANNLIQRAGVKAFTYGLSLRMIFYSLLVSLQFLLYDTVRIALGVGSDDMKLYLNVLGAALQEATDA